MDYKAKVLLLTSEFETDANFKLVKVWNITIKFGT